VNTRLHVAVGVITNPEKNQVLITKRTSNQHLAGLWEFPGGKVEKNETVQSALFRELEEELGIIVNEARQLTTVSHDYPDKKVLLDVWCVESYSGSPNGKENQEVEWVEVNKLHNYEFPEANKHIVQTLTLDPIYLINPLEYISSSKFITKLEQCFKSGINLYQLRLEKKNNPDFEIIVKKVIKLAKKYRVKLVLNGKPSDLNLYDVSGIHLKSLNLMEYEKRPISQDYILGASCHNEKELLQAEKLNVNYAFISPVLKTTSHQEAKGIGWEAFSGLSKKVKFPVYALGGMSPMDLEMAQKHNAHGIAMINAIWNQFKT
jgi:8-oxo-dGTP diphosphatase